MKRNGAPSKKATLGNSHSRNHEFLDCKWDDPIWKFKPSNVMDESRDLTVDWGFSLPNGGGFCDPDYAGMLESSRQLVYLIRGHSLTGSRQRVSTTIGYFYYLKVLVRWMVDTGYTQFRQLDAQAVLQFKQVLMVRPGVGRQALAASTIQKYLYLFTYLYRFREKLNDGLDFLPFPGSTPGRIANARECDLRRWPYTPDIVAVPLLKQCIDLLTKESAQILQARDVYRDSMKIASARGIGFNACCNAATKALIEANLKAPFSEGRITTLVELAKFVDMLYAACFVVLSYLVGARASEILQLQVGCIKYIGEGTSQTPVIVGAIFKRQPEYHGRPHEWVAPAPAVLAISILESLSLHHRTREGRAHLWLRRRRDAGSTEWVENCSGVLGIPPTSTVNAAIRRLAAWLKVPLFENKVWSLATHQGRKTFVRFAALRDRTSLHAIAQHLGHRERAITDHGYSGRDYRLQDEIDAEVIENSTSAWEQMLVSDSLAGLAGAEIEVTRPRFRGERMKLEVKAYARMLVDAGLTLGVCDWGFCVYREGGSACLGNAAGPNPVRREPSTCARCANFAVTEVHRPYWVGQRDRHSDLLNNTALPKQTLNIARSRLNEAQSIVQKLDKNAESSKK